MAYLLDGRINHNVKIVTTLELGQITTNGWQTFSRACFRELVSRTVTETAGNVLHALDARQLTNQNVLHALDAMQLRSVLAVGLFVFIKRKHNNF